MTPPYRIGVDVGGTFTDCVAVGADGSVTLEKAPTTPDDQSAGVLDGIERLAAALGVASATDLLAVTDSIVHGTTTGDNTMIQMSGAPTGLLVTEGFRDEIELRRCYKEDIWDPALPAPQAIARRRVRLEVRERLTAEGEVDVPLDEESVRRAARRLRALGVRSIAIVLLHSYRNPVHEQRARDIVLEEVPDVELTSLSHEVHPKPPEFERTSTTLVNAFVGPPIVRYLERLTARLSELGYARELLIATCSGGVATPASIGRRAVATIGSGPTGGVVAAAEAARAAGLGDVVSVDMGGTSYDVCLIRDGRPELKTDWNWRHRYCIALPMVDIHAIGAGGGSIARDVAGQLHVGPDSAGAQPGPVSYRRGGTEPTVTDADLVLGRLDAAAFWGGRLTLDADGATAALGKLGAAFGWSAEEAAVAIVRLVDAHMTDAVRRVLSLAGADPRALDLVAFGGMGAVHATTQAAALGMRRVLVPRAAPAFSALGLVSADHVVDATRTAIAPWQAIDTAELNRLSQELEEAARGELHAAGVADDRIRLEWLLNLVYPGQTFDTGLPLTRAAGAPITDADVAVCVEEFHRRNEAARLIEARAQEPTIRGLRLVATGVVDRPAVAPLARHAGAVVPVATRRMWADGWHDAAAVHRLDELGAGARVAGPAVLEDRFTTLVLRPGDEAEVGPTGDVLVAVG
jgi:N-methylhydantoinase A